MELGFDFMKKFSSLSILPFQMYLKMGGSVARNVVNSFSENIDLSKKLVCYFDSLR